MIHRVGQGAIWAVALLGALILLELSVTGRLAILTAVAFLPNDVAYIGA